MNVILDKYSSVHALVDDGQLQLCALDEAGAMSPRYVGDLEWE